MYMILHDNNNIIAVPDISNPYLNRGGIRNDKKCIYYILDMKCDLQLENINQNDKKLTSKNRNAKAG